MTNRPEDSVRTTPNADDVFNKRIFFGFIGIAAILLILLALKF